MLLTPEAAERAREVFNNLTVVQVYEVNPAVIPELPLLVFTKLHARDHYEVAEWGEALEDAIRRKNPRARLNLQIHGNRITARTNIDHNTAILVVIMAWHWLKSNLLAMATFDAAILSAATAPEEIAAK